MCDFTKGETIYTTGLNMKCKKVVCKVKFVRETDDGRVVIECKGLKVIGGKVSDYYKTARDCKAAIAK